jgi:hypothetical protein
VSSTKWMPADDELDGLARTLPAAERTHDRVDQERTELLAQAAATSQQRRGSRVPLIASTAFAAAAAVVLWFVVRPGGPSQPKESITALGPAQYERIGAWPDFVARLDDGRIDVLVTELLAGERFRVTTSDAEVEAGGARFIVSADHGRIESVAVGRGRVEVRWAHQPSIFLAAGQSWSPTKMAQREADDLMPAAPIRPDAAPAPAVVGINPAPTVKPVAPVRPATTKPRVATSPVATSSSIQTSTTSTRVETTAPTSATPTDAKPSPNGTTNSEVTTPTTPSVAARPGEADFRSGIASLRAGNAAAAVTAFAAACKTAEKDGLAEDACFWLGAAAKRAGQAATARDALTRFLKAYPSSARAGEASALLGWLLYDAGEIDAAQQRFELAAQDRVAKVRESAERGIEAIKRKRSAP